MADCARTVGCTLLALFIAVKLAMPTPEPPAPLVSVVPPGASSRPVNPQPPAMLWFRVEVVDDADKVIDHRVLLLTQHDARDIAGIDSIAWQALMAERGNVWMDLPLETVINLFGDDVPPGQPLRVPKRVIRVRDDPLTAPVIRVRASKLLRA